MACNCTLRIPCARGPGLASRGVGGGSCKREPRGCFGLSGGFVDASHALPLYPSSQTQTPSCQKAVEEAPSSDGSGATQRPWCEQLFLDQSHGERSHAGPCQPSQHRQLPVA